MRTTSRWIDGAAIAAIVVVAIATHAPLMGLDATLDELALLGDDTWRKRWLSPENGINPPLFPWTLALVPEAWDLLVGRVLQGMASVAACVATWWAVRSGGAQHRAGALAAGLVVAAHPALAVETTVCRTYGGWWLALVLHLQAAAALADDPDDRGALTRWRATFVLLPWLHYLSFAWLGAEAAWLAWRDRARLRTVWAAPLAWLPLAAWIVWHADARAHVHGEPLAWAYVVGGGVTPDQASAVWLLEGGLVAALATLRRASPSTRVLVVGGAGLWAIAASWNAYESIRVPIAAVAAALVVPGVFRGAWTPREDRGTIVFVVGCLITASLSDIDRTTLPHADRRIARDLHDAWATVVGLAADDDLQVPGDAEVFALGARFGTWRDATDPTCPSIPCVQRDGVTVRVGDGAGLVARPRREAVREDCTVAAELPTVRLMRCATDRPAEAPSGATPRRPAPRR